MFFNLILIEYDDHLLIHREMTRLIISAVGVVIAYIFWITMAVILGGESFYFMLMMIVYAIFFLLFVYYQTYWVLKNLNIIALNMFRRDKNNLKLKSIVSSINISQRSNSDRKNTNVTKR